MERKILHVGRGQVKRWKHIAEQEDTPTIVEHDDMEPSDYRIKIEQVEESVPLPGQYQALKDDHARLQFIARLLLLESPL